MKKFLTIISIMLFVFVLIGCGGSKPQPEDPGTQPEDPGTQPEDPGTQPEDPGTQPEDPSDNENTVEKYLELFTIDDIAKIEIEANKSITSKKDYVSAKL